MVCTARISHKPDCARGSSRKHPPGRFASRPRSREWSHRSSAGTPQLEGTHRVHIACSRSLHRAPRVGLRFRAVLHPGPRHLVPHRGGDHHRHRAGRSLASSCMGRRLRPVGLRPRARLLGRPAGRTRGRDHPRRALRAGDIDEKEYRARLEVLRAKRVRSRPPARWAPRSNPSPNDSLSFGPNQARRRDFRCPGSTGLVAADPERSAAVRASLAVGLAVSAYGLSFGALAVASGLDIWQTQVLSLFMFSGGSQFAVIGVLASGGVAAGPAAITGAALLGVRNSLYSMRMAPIVGGPPTPRGWARRAARRPLDDRRVDRGLHRPADAARSEHRVLDDRGRHLRRLEPDNAAGLAAGQPDRRCPDVRPRCRRGRRLSRAALAPADLPAAGRGRRSSRRGRRPADPMVARRPAGADRGPRRRGRRPHELAGPQAGRQEPA